jgi:predicted acetyltransferase
MLTRLPSAEKPFMENYAIVLKSVAEGMEAGEQGGMIGVIGIPRLSYDGSAAEVGYAISPDFWGRGYASEALILFVQHYFNSERKSLIAVPISRPSVCLSVCLSVFHSSFVCSTAREELKIRVCS